MKSRRRPETHASGRKGTLASGLFFLLILFFVAWAGWYDINYIAPDHRLEELEPVIQAAARKHGVPVALAMAVIWKESRFRSGSVGKAGEIGLMQIMPGAVEEWFRGTRQERRPSRKELFTPEMNLEIGLWYLAWCGRHWETYKSAEILQLAEYNAGYSRVSQWKPKDPQTSLSLEQISIPTTREYVRQILEKRDFYDLRNRKKDVN